EPAAVRARPASRREGARAARLPRGAGSLPPRDGGARPRLPARRGLRREGRYVHELRASRPARARRGAAAGRGATRRGDHRGRGRFIPARQIETAAELPDADYPFVLNTGRLLYHWHGGTLTRRVQGLMELAPRLEIAIHPSDARRLGVDDGARLRVESRRGELTGYARVTEAVKAGAIFV